MGKKCFLDFPFKRKGTRNILRTGYILVLLTMISLAVLLNFIIIRIAKGLNAHGEPLVVLQQIYGMGWQLNTCGIIWNVT